MNRTRDGNILLLVLLTMVLVTGMLAAIVRQTAADARTNTNQAVLQQQETVARTGLAIARQVTFGPLQQAIQAITTDTADFGADAYYTGDSSGDSTTARLLQGLQGRANTLLCNAENPDGLNTGDLNVMVYFLADSACPNGNLPPNGLTIPPVTPLSPQSNGIQVYEVPFVLVAEATLGGISKVLTQPGAFTITLGQGGLNHYAILARDTSNAVFDRNIPVDGPVHSNTVWWVTGKAWFGDTVSSAGCQDGPSCGVPSADLGIGGSATQRVSAADLSPTPDAPCSGAFCPTFTAGVDYAAPPVAFPGDTDVAAAAISGGITITGDVYELLLDGRPTSTGSRQQLIRTCDVNAACTTYRLNEDGSVDIKPNGYIGFTSLMTNFNGLIYVAGRIERLRAESSYSPAYNEAQSFTIAAQGDIRILTSLRSDRPACSTHITRNAEGQVQLPECLDATTANIAALGVYSTTGNLIIGDTNGDPTLEPSGSVTLHAALLAPNGTFRIQPSAPGQEIRLLGSLSAAQLPAFTSSAYTLLMDYDPRFGPAASIKPRGFPLFTAGFLNATAKIGAERAFIP